jgi:hypothetical protein
MKREPAHNESTTLGAGKQSNYSLSIHKIKFLKT